MRPVAALCRLIGVAGEQTSNAAVDAGAVYVFHRPATAWVQQAYVKASNTGAGDSFGHSLALSGDTVIVGAPQEDSNATGVNGSQQNDLGQGSGAAYILSGCVLGAPFTDVPESHPFCGEIKWARDSGVSTGFNDGTYRPAEVVTRMAMSAFIARVGRAALAACTEPPYSDVPISHPFCRQIKWQKEVGIAGGFDDGTYRPANPVTRMAMAAFLARLAGGQLTNCTTAPFSDVPTTHTFCKEIKWMKESGVSTGFPDGTFRPANEVTRQAMAAFLLRVSFLTP